tara:strand:+ start:124 stop:1149 length:1026 start_codon:yes stop_codon:yes gene_type:complete
MEKNKKLFIISNEKVYSDKNQFYCDNIDMKSIPENLNKNFDSTLILRKTKFERSHQINISKIKLSSNFFSFLFNVYKSLKENNANYLIVSITPYTFFAYLLLFVFRKKIYVYLRSNGYEEYKKILGLIGPLIYHIMYLVVTFDCKLITCQKRLSKKKSDLVFPSELDHAWLDNTKLPNLDNPKLLYVGRIKIEKGIFSLINIFKKTSENYVLSIVGVGKKEDINLDSKNIKYLGSGYKPEELIKIYDDHNILILPSYTEAHPKVVDESLARLRPVIIFEDISHIIQNRNGIFIAKRNVESLSSKIEFIMTNYSSIQESMKKNKLPTKNEFFSQINRILSLN